MARGSRGASVDRSELTPDLVFQAGAPPLPSLKQVGAEFVLRRRLFARLPTANSALQSCFHVVQYLANLFRICLRSAYAKHFCRNLGRTKIV